MNGAAAFVLAAAVLVCAMWAGPWLWTSSLPAGDGVLQRGLVYGLVIGPLALTAWFMSLYEGRGRREGVLSGIAAAGFGSAVGAGAFGFALTCAVLLGGGSITPSAWGGAALASAVLLTLAQAAGEEWFFRGWLQPLLGARWGPWIGLSATAVLFGVAHGMAGSAGLPSLFNTVVAGLAFGLLAFRTGGLLAPAAAHWVWNSAEMSVFGVSPNPGVDSLGAFVDVDLPGPGWLGGGPEGLNASLTTSAALLAVVVLVGVLPGRAPAKAGLAPAG